MKVKGLDHIAIIGTGMIGASLATLFTGNGYKTTMLAVNEKEAKSGKDKYDANFKDLIEKGLAIETQKEACAKLLDVTQKYEDIAEADFIYECVIENLEAKRSVYAQLEKNCGQVKAIASSSSAISADDLAEGFDRLRDKFLVAHPFNPPHLVPLVEILKSRYTSDEAAATLIAALESTGRKIAVMKKSAPGFIANRLQHALYREAVYMVENGITTPKDIDLALKYSFIPRYTSIGLFEHFDYAGLDMILSIEDYLFPTLCNACSTQDYIRSRYEAGNLGSKSGKGVYDWSKIDMNEFRQKAAKPYLSFFNWDLPKE